MFSKILKSDKFLYSRNRLNIGCFNSCVLHMQMLMLKNNFTRINYGSCSWGV